MKSSFERRISILEGLLPTPRPGINCPRCMVLASRPLNELVLDKRCQAYLSGNPAAIIDQEPLPEPSPECPDCQEIFSMSEAAIDAKLHRWIAAREKVKEFRA